jgi:hypothetical protein
MPSQVTYTGKIGPGATLTAKVFSDVRRMAFDFEKRTLQLNYYNGIGGGDPEEAILDMSGGTVTLTDTITANNHVVAISVA